MTIIRAVATGLIAIILIAGIVWAGDWAIQKSDTGKAEMVISGGKRGDVPFNHHKHQAAQECRDCHELFPQKSGAIAALQANGRLAKKAVMKQCQICHRKKARAGEPTGPVTCKKCHSLKQGS